MVQESVYPGIASDWGKDATVPVGEDPIPHENHRYKQDNLIGCGHIFGMADPDVLHGSLQQSHLMTDSLKIIGFPANHPAVVVP